jgi:hypothetical protein
MHNEGTEYRKDESRDHIERALTNASVTIPIEVFEKRYLTPQMPGKGDLYKRLANPTPL